jgi:hypothetical protein
MVKYYDRNTIQLDLSDSSSPVIPGSGAPALRRRGTRRCHNCRFRRSINSDGSLYRARNIYCRQFAPSNFKPHRHPDLLICLLYLKVQ